MQWNTCTSLYYKGKHHKWKVQRSGPASVQDEVGCSPTHNYTTTTATDEIRIGTSNFGVLDAAINATSVRKSCAHMQVEFIAVSCTSSVVLWHLDETSQFLWHHTINLPFNSSTVMPLLCYMRYYPFWDIATEWKPNFMTCNHTIPRASQSACIYSMYLQYAWSHLLYYQSLIWYVMYLCILLSIVLGPWASTVLSRGANPPNATYSHIVPE